MHQDSIKHVTELSARMQTRSYYLCLARDSHLAQIVDDSSHCQLLATSGATCQQKRTNRSSFTKQHVFALCVGAINNVPAILNIR